MLSGLLACGYGGRPIGPTPPTPPTPTAPTPPTPPTPPGLPVASVGSDAPVAPEPSRANTLFQAGTFSQLLASDLRGIWSFAEIKPHGDFGLGTFEGIDGELVVADGAYWQVHPDGHVTEVADTQRTPFAEVIHFKPESKGDLKGPLTCAKTLRIALSKIASLSEAAAESALGQASESTKVSKDASEIPVDDENIDVFRVRARFSMITTRAIDKQYPPYKPLAEIVPTEHKFPMKNVSGTLVVIRAPKHYGPVTIPGYHFHFITDDHKRGGHVLSCTLESGTVEHQRATALELWFPTPTTATVAPPTGLPTPN
jgi:acetolactate decarboxylase